MTTSNPIVRVSVTRGDYEGASYEGPLSEAPVTVLVPEGISSARTIAEAENVAQAARLALESAQAVEIHAALWSVRIERVTA